jgi:molybdopterin converting factor small subunit
LLTDITASESEIIDLKPGSFSYELKSDLIGKYPAFEEIPLVLFQDQRICKGNTELIPGVDIDCMPPFSGG